MQQSLLRTFSATALLFGAYASASANDLFWTTEANGALPFDAPLVTSPASFTGEYVCRAQFRSGVHPGRIEASGGKTTNCLISFGGKAVSIPNYEVLTPGWVGAQGGTIPAGALAWGTDVNGDPPFVCRARYQGGLEPGKLKSSLGGCSIGTGGLEVVLQSYDVFAGTDNGTGVGMGALPSDDLAADSGARQASSTSSAGKRLPACPNSFA